MVNTIMKFLLRALAILFGGSSIVVVVALMIRPDDALIMLAPAVFFLLLAGALWYWSSAPDRQRRAMAQAKTLENLLQCECCDFFTITESKMNARCTICGWQQTDSAPIEPNLPSDANNGLTLRVARANLLKCGASSPTMLKNVLPVSKRVQYRYAQRSI